MPINQRDLLNAIAQLVEDKNVRVTVTESLKGAMLVGTATFIGGLFLGPLGLAAGGVLGGLTAASTSRNNFRPLHRVILEDMSVTQQALLAQRVTNVLKDFAITDLAVLLPLLVSNAGVTEAIMGAVINYVQSDMNLKILN